MTWLQKLFNKIIKRDWQKYWNNKYPKVYKYRKKGKFQVPYQLLITPNDPLIRASLVYFDLYPLPEKNKYDNAVLRIYRKVRKNSYPYTHDKANTGDIDYWMAPYELRYYKKGDCDDFAHELASYLIAAGVPNWRVRVVVGKTYSGRQHSTVYYLRDDMKTWVHLNSTSFIAGNVQSLDHDYFNTDSAMAIKKVRLSFNNKYVWKG